MTDFVQTGGGNTGTYGAYAIRVKGDGLIEARDARGRGTLHRNMVDAKKWLDNPVPYPPPMIVSISPASRPINTPVTITIQGSGFFSDSVVKGDAGTLVSTFVSANLMTADVPGIGTPGTRAITVTSDAIVSNAVTFTITATMMDEEDADPFG